MYGSQITRERVTCVVQYNQKKFRLNFALDKNQSLQTDSKEKGTLCRWHVQRPRAVMSFDRRKEMMEDEAPEIQRPCQTKEFILLA